MYLSDGVPVVFRQTADAMRDVQLMLANDGGSRVAQQLVVVQQRASNRVLDGQHANGGGVLAHLRKNFFECATAYQLNLFSLEIEVGSNVVERPYQTLYRYSLHNS